MKRDIKLGIQVRDFGRQVGAILYRDSEELTKQEKHEIYNFLHGKWQSYSLWEHIEGNPDVEISLDIEALRRVAMTMYQGGLLRDAPPGYVPVSQYEDLRRKFEEAKQAHLDDVRLLIKTAKE